MNDCPKCGGQGLRGVTHACVTSFVPAATVYPALLHRTTRDSGALPDPELDSLRARLGETEDALRRIAENAESWHGVRPENSGHVRALDVIAQWARAVIDGSGDV